MRPTLFPSQFGGAQCIVLLGGPRGSLSSVFYANLGRENSPLCVCCLKRSPGGSTPRKEPAPKQDAELAALPTTPWCDFFWSTQLKNPGWPDGVATQVARMISVPGEARQCRRGAPTAPMSRSLLALDGFWAASRNSNGRGSADFRHPGTGAREGRQPALKLSEGASQGIGIVPSPL